MTDELKKEIKEALDVRLRDLLFEPVEMARGVMKRTIREVLEGHNIFDAKVVTTNEAGKDVAAIIEVGGRTYECKFVVRSAPFEELQGGSSIIETGV